MYSTRSHTYLYAADRKYFFGGYSVSNHKMQRSEKRVLFFVLSILVLSAGLFLHCFHGPTSGLPTYLEITGVNLSGAPDIRTFFVGDKISVRIEVLEVEPVDSIVFAIIK